jgi:hypothetical protein
MQSSYGLSLSLSLSHSHTHTHTHNYLGKLHVRTVSFFLSVLSLTSSTYSMMLLKVTVVPEDTHEINTLGRTPMASDRPVAEKSTDTTCNIQSQHGIRSHEPNKQAFAD